MELALALHEQYRPAEVLLKLQLAELADASSPFVLSIEWL